tara:strand:+ start:519 stop:722 length:204 start_codon:yes stop_codon:yes gene_type:complete
MKKVELPPRTPVAAEYTTILSARVKKETYKKWEELQLKQGKTRIRPGALMEYMVGYFHDEVFGGEDE